MEEKVIPAPIEVVILDEISRKLDRLVEIVEMQIPEGVVGPAIEIDVDTKKRKRTINSKGVRSLELINSGSNAVNVLVNRKNGIPTKILPGESLKLNSNFRVWKYIYFWTDSGSSTLRVNYSY